MDKKAIWFRIAGLTICAAVLIAALSMLFQPKRMSFPYDITRKVKGFYEEPKNSLDIIFVGSSELFSTINPAVLWREQGITSYVFAANEQNTRLSYYYIREALRYQKPQAVVLEMSYCNFGERQRDSVVRINLDDMKWGINKIEAIVHNVPAADWSGYFINFMKYHDRWKELSANDFRMYNGRNPYKGWTPFEEQEDEPIGDVNTKQIRQLGEESQEWLYKIIDLCRREETEIIFLKTPNGNKTCLPAAGSDGYENAEGQPYYNEVQRIADEDNITFWNYNLWMEGKKHNNVADSTRITSDFGKRYAQTHDFMDKRGEKAYSYWEEDASCAYEYINKAMESGEESGLQ